MSKDIIKIENLMRVDVKADDVFVLQVKELISIECANRLRTQWAEAWVGRDVPKLIVLDSGSELGVIRNEDAV